MLERIIYDNIHCLENPKCKYQKLGEYNIIKCKLIEQKETYLKGCGVVKNYDTDTYKNKNGDEKK